jgi:hypothetical protein
MLKTITVAAIAVAAVTLSACSPNGATTAEAPAAATAAAPMSFADMEAVIARHVVTVKAADLEGVMADYADDAILVGPPGIAGNPQGTFVGKDKVREFFVWLATPEVLPAAQSMVTTNELVGENTVLFLWTQFPGTPQELKGWDIFVFENGKIIFQTTAPLPPA